MAINRRKEEGESFNVAVSQFGFPFSCSLIALIIQSHSRYQPVLENNLSLKYQVTQTWQEEEFYFE